MRTVIHRALPAAGSRAAIGSRLQLLALASGVALVLADGAVVVLALPELVFVLDTSIAGVAAIVAVYTAALALAAAVAPPVIRAAGAPRVAAAGAVGFAGASLVCALAQTFPVMVAGRGVQGASGGALLVAATAMLAARPDGRRAAGLATLVGLTAGPAVGGALTQVLGWPAMFAVAIPIALLSAWAALRTAPAVGQTPPAARKDGRVGRRDAIAFALLSAAAVAVLFVTVLRLVTGWGLQPLQAAAVMTLLPVATVAGMRLGAAADIGAAGGATLAAGGIAAMAIAPSDAVAVVACGLVCAGVGLGVALPSLERRMSAPSGARGAARVNVVRHIAITAALLALAPVLASDLDDASTAARERQITAILRAELPALDKLSIAQRVVAIQPGTDVRAKIRQVYEQEAQTTAHPAAVAAARADSDRIIVGAANETTRNTLLLLGSAALAAAVISPPSRRRRLTLVAPALVAVALIGATAVIGARSTSAVAVPAPCATRTVGTAGGPDAQVQAPVVHALTRAACRVGASPEEVLVAMGSRGEAERFRRDHGVAPGDVLLDLGEGLLRRAPVRTQVPGAGAEGRSGCGAPGSKRVAGPCGPVRSEGSDQGPHGRDDRGDRGASASTRPHRGGSA